MTKRIRRVGIHTVVAAASLLIVAPRVSAQLRLPAIFGEHMVLQRNAPLPVWGWAEPGERVSVFLANASAETRAGDDGQWRVTLPAQSAGGPFALNVTAESSQIVFRDVLVGEVWIASGQSNMQWSLRSVANSEAEIAAADYPDMRLFGVERTTSYRPVDDVVGSWQICTPETVPGFSAVAYFFGRRLHSELEVPVGLINSSWGGTIIEAWTDRASMSAVFDGAERLAVVDSAAARTPQLLPDPRVQNPNQPTVLFNAMVHPLIPFALRGAIWYQGESNLRDGKRYLDRMQALILGWRGLWNLGSFPFYYVQLAPFRYGADPLLLAEIWEAQYDALAIPNTGMAVITDITDLDDIHPTNKQDVGYRLALWALARAYGKDIPAHSGPLYARAQVESGALRLYFEHADGLASRDGGELTWFEVAGEDTTYYPAMARIEGGTVVVSSPEVPAPQAARFGWHQTAEPNLVNGQGLPASPFRTHRDE